MQKQTLPAKKTSIFIDALLIFALGILVFHAVLNQVKYEDQRRQTAQMELQEYARSDVIANRYQHFLQLLDIWSDAIVIADGTVSSDLENPLRDLKRIRRMAFEIPTPNQCMVQIKNNLIQNMDLSIDQFTEMMDNHIVHRSEMIDVFQLKYQLATRYERCVINH